MGYQVVDVFLKDGRVLKNVIVTNAEQLMVPPGYKDLRPDDILRIEVVSTR